MRYGLTKRKPGDTVAPKVHSSNADSTKILIEFTRAPNIWFGGTTVFGSAVTCPN